MSLMENLVVFLTPVRFGLKLAPESYISPQAARIKGMSHRRVTVNDSSKRKQSLYFPVEMLEEMNLEAQRQERPLSWLMQQAWKIALPQITSYPGVNDYPGNKS